MFAAIFGILALAYPLWGAACLFIFCRVLARKGNGTIIQRFRWSLYVAMISAAVFTPAGWGTMGFGFLIPWFIAIFFERQFTMFAWELFAFTFGVAFIATLIQTQVVTTLFFLGKEKAIDFLANIRSRHTGSSCETEVEIDTPHSDLPQAQRNRQPDLHATIETNGP